MSIQDFITFLKGLGLTTPIYPLAFPATAPEQCMMLEVGQGVPARGSVSDITLTVTVRAGYMKDAEKLSQQVIDLLKGRTDEPLGESQIILIKSQQLVPSYLGKSAEGYHYYMNNFRVLVND
ncbi:minor capsid protein [Priestia megaterium]|uniref:minor capsid protein n=1 Tax=Priestia megaterium TaxID=1404 RepID=UPI002E1CE679|nr:minor capsid protein [Priestia megaterium]